MTKGFYNLTSGMLTQTRRLDTVSNNMTNVATAGYKTETYVDTTFEEYMTSIVGNKIPDGSTPIGEQTYMTAPDELHVNYSQGLFEQTGLPLDFAISGDGFFAIATDAGTEYTRNGSFILNELNQIALPNQGAVLSDTGVPITLPTDDFYVDNVGNVIGSETGDVFGRIGVYAFADNNLLVKNQSALFGTGGQAANQVDVPILWKSVESSNVDMTREMASMMTTQRAFQSAASVFKIYDGILTKATNDIGRLV